MQYEASEVETATKAINDLEVAIMRSKATLLVQKKTIQSLKQLVDQYDEIKKEFQPLDEDEPRPYHMRDTVESRITAQIDRGANDMKVQLDTVEREANELCSHISSLEKELIGWQYTRSLATSYLLQIQQHREKVEKNLYHAKAPFSAVLRVPMELWIKIFSLCLNDLFLQSIEDCSIPPLLLDGKAPFTLSLTHVCSRWRSIVWQTAALWVYPFTHRPRLASESDTFNLFLEQSKFHLDLIMDIPGDVTNESDPTWSIISGHKIRLQSYLERLSTMEYSLTICLSNSFHCVLAINSTEFSRPTMLHLIAPQTGVSMGIFHRIRSFESVRELKLTNCTSYGQHVPDLCPSVTDLTIQYTTSETEFYSGFLGGKRLPRIPGQITRLVIRGVNLVDGPTQRPGSIQLESLKELGVSPPQRALIEQLSAPSLDTLILYGGLEGVHLEPSYTHFKDVFASIKHLKFEDWKPQALSPQQTVCGITSLLLRHASSFSQVTNLTFIESFVRGESLVDLLESAGSARDACLPLLIKELSLTRCSGITLSQCERMVRCVDKFNVFV